MSDQSLGTISAAITLSLTQLEANVAEVKTMIGGMAADMAASLTQAEQETAASLSRQAAGLAQQVGGMMQAAGFAIEGALGLAVKAGMDFDASLTEIGNNTTMTVRDLETMRSAVSEIGADTGANMKQAAEGFAHAENFAFSAAESMQIMNEATKAAVSTGSDAGKTTEILAKSLHEFGMQASQASAAMNVLHLAAAEGNMTLQQFDEAAGPAFAQAANLGVSLNDTAAAMAALTRHGLNASEAATQVKDILIHMINPSKGAREELERLSKATGVDLVSDFSQAGLASRGFAGVLDDLSKATNGNGQEIYKLIQAQRGGLGAMILAGTGAKDLHDILSDLAKAYSGELTPVEDAFARQQETLAAQVAKAKNELLLMSEGIEKALLPALIPLIDDVKQAAQWFENLPESMKKGTLEVLALSGAVLLVGGSLLKLIGTVQALSAAVVALDIDLTAFWVALTGPVGVAVGVAALAIWGLKSAFDAFTTADMQATDALKGDAQAQEDAAKKTLANAEEVDRLVKRYEELKAIAKPTTDQLTEMRDIMDKVGRLSPDLVTGYDAQGHALGFIAGEAKKAAAALMEEARAAQIASAANIAKQNQDRADQRDKLAQDLKRQQYLLQSREVLLPGDHPATGNFRDNPLAVDSSGNPMGDVRMPNRRKATSDEVTQTGQKVQGLINQIADLDKKSQDAGKAMRDIFHPPDEFTKATAGLGLGLDFHDSSSFSRPGGGSGGGGNSSGGGSGAMDDMKAKAEQAAQSIKRVRDELFALTNTPFDTERRQALQEYSENLADGVSKADALALLKAQNAKIIAEEKAFWDKMQTAAHAGLEKTFAEVSDAMGDKGMARITQATKEAAARAEAEFSSDIARIIAIAKGTEMESASVLQRDEDNAKEALAALHQEFQELFSMSDAEEQERRNTEKAHEGDKVKRNKNGTISYDYPKAQSDLKKALESMRGDVEGILGGALTELFEHGTKNLFKEMVLDFEKSLEQMAAKALIAGIGNMIFGGIPGGFLGGLASVFGIGGRSAGSGGGSGEGGRAAGSVVVNFHGPVHMRSDSDIDALSKQIAWHAQLRLPATVQR